MLGIWMWADTLTARGADKVFDDCMLIGVTDVFFLTKGLSGNCAFRTDLAPAMLEGRDLLDEALGAAHKRGIRLHAWFTSAQDKRYCSEHPECGLYHLTKGRSESIVSITDESYARFTHDIVSDVLAAYPVDGVHLDYIRYNHLLYGWSDGDLERYRRQGADADRIRKLVERTFYGDDADKQAVFEAYRQGDRDVRALAETRINNVCRFADTVLEGVRTARPDITVSAALMPEGAYDTVFAHLHYGQDYERLSGKLDLLLPMAYSIAYSMDDAWVRKVTIGALRFGPKVLTGLHAYEGGTGETLKKDMAAVLGVEGVSGVCLFRYGTAVLALVNGNKLTVTNPTDAPVTALELSGGKGKQGFEMTIPSGESVDIPYSAGYDALRAWSGDKEICAFMS
ncbi:MAG: family 10 glycosylhydrolase [Clostridia bacterium]|nr:family 10 glycosylhydrolase [Clostridia bacterium]